MWEAASSKIWNWLVFPFMKQKRWYYMKYYEKAKNEMDMEAAEFFGGVSEIKIEQAMQELSLVFPESYKAFLKDFGGGDAGGEFILGITDVDEESMVMATLKERSVGMPKHFVIIGFFDGSLCCLDTSQMKDRECPVVMLTEDYYVAERVSDSFGHFLYDYECED